MRRKGRKENRSERAKGALEKPLRGKVHRTDFSTSLGNPQNLGIPTFPKRQRRRTVFYQGNRKTGKPNPTSSEINLLRQKNGLDFGVHHSTRSRSDGTRLFVVIGAQRTGTNILREILNTNEQIAMLGEVLSPSLAPAHWDNFCRALPARTVLPATFNEAESLLDRYFDFVLYRIRNYWEGNKKRDSHAFGVDIKYNQLGRIAPANWSSSFSPFILSYLRSCGTTLIHTTRNVIHCAISTLIASRRNIWHNYDGAVIDRNYHLDVEECLACARGILQHRNAFIEYARGCQVVDCRYERLIDDLGRAGSKEEIPEAPGPLSDIANALGSSFRFRYDRRLKKAIDVPYSRLLSNYDDFVNRLQDSEFSSLVLTLQ